MRQFPVDDLVDRRGDQHLDAVRHAIFDQAVRLGLRIGVVAEKNGFDSELVEHVFDILLRLEIINRPFGDLVIFEPAAVGDESAHVVMRRVLQPHDERHLLRLDTVDQRADTVRPPDVREDDRIVKQNHQHAHRNEHTNRHEQIQHHAETDRLEGHPVGPEPQYEEHQQLFEQGSGPELPYFAQRRMADDGTVGTENIECDGAAKERRHQQKQIMKQGKAGIPDEIIDTQKSDQRRRGGYREINGQNQPRPDITAVQMQPFNQREKHEYESVSLSFAT